MPMRTRGSTAWTTRWFLSSHRKHRADDEGRALRLKARPSCVIFATQSSGRGLLLADDLERLVLAQFFIGRRLVVLR